MTVEDLDSLTRKLLTKVREIKIDIWTNSDKTKEDVEKALSLKLAVTGGSPQIF